MSQKGKSDWGRRWALCAIYVYFLILIVGMMYGVSGLSRLVFIDVMIPILVAGILGLSGWIYCMVHAGRRKDLIHPQKLSLLLAIIFFNCTACLFYLHSKTLFYPRSDSDNEKSSSLVRTKILQLYLFTVSIFILVFVFALIESNLHDLRYEEDLHVAVTELVDKSERSLQSGDFLDAYKQLDPYHWSALRNTGSRLTLDSQLRRVLSVGIAHYLKSGDLESATTLLGGACKHGFITSSASQSLKEALQQVIAQYEARMKRHLEQKQFQEALQTYESSLALKPCMKTELKGGFLQLKLLKEQAEQSQRTLSNK